jgi:hypothetical protein
MFFPRLFYYKNGISLPDNKENTIKTTEKEERQLLKLKNGYKPVFEVVRERTRREPVTEE